MKLATVFSGIGAIEQALLKLNIKHEIVFACDTGERYLSLTYDEISKNIKKLSPNDIKKYIDNLYDQTGKINYVKKSYFENYDINEESWYNDIRFINGKQYKGSVDLLVGGSPCQSFSIIGKRGGLEDARGTLFYSYAKLIKEIQPKVFIFENVVGMLNHNRGETWKTIECIFEKLGYKIFGPEILNSKDFGIPQDRKRIFVVGFKDKKVKFKFPTKQNIQIPPIEQFYESNVDAKFYLGKKGFEFVTNVKYKNRARVGRDIIQTQKANQQFNWNGDFIFVPFEKINDREDILKRAHIGEYQGKKGAIRQMTHRECLRLMGFPDSFKIVVPNVHAYRQAGNSIVVNVLEAIVKEIMKVVEFDE